jgi:hypothetical protein
MSHVCVYVYPMYPMYVYPIYQPDTHTHIHTYKGTCDRDCLCVCVCVSTVYASTVYCLLPTVYCLASSSSPAVMLYPISDVACIRCMCIRLHCIRFTGPARASWLGSQPHPCPPAGRRHSCPSPISYVYQ